MVRHGALSDNQEEHDEDFPWSTFAQLPSARLVFLDVGTSFYRRACIIECSLYQQSTIIQGIRQLLLDRSKVSNLPKPMRAPLPEGVRFAHYDDVAVLGGPRCGTGRGRRGASITGSVGQPGGAGHPEPCRTNYLDRWLALPLEALAQRTRRANNCGVSGAVVGGALGTVEK